MSAQTVTLNLYPTVPGTDTTEGSTHMLLAELSPVDPFARVPIDSVLESPCRVATEEGRFRLALNAKPTTFNIRMESNIPEIILFIPLFLRLEN
jgi:hypothetical protein